MARAVWQRNAYRNLVMLTPPDYALAGMAIASVLGDAENWQPLAEKAALDMYRLRVALGVSGMGDAAPLLECMIAALAESGAIWANARNAGLTGARRN